MYSVRVLRQAVKDIATLPREYVRPITEHIDRLQENPRPPDAKRLKGTTDYSLRVGVYRVLYDIDDGAQSVTVYRVKHRRDAYR